MSDNLLPCCNPNSAAFDFSQDGPVAVLRLQSGPVNAMRFHDWRAFIARIQSLPDLGVSVLVITGYPGKHFCAGNDIREFCGISAQDALDGAKVVRDVTRALAQSPVVSIAALHGAAMGSGLMMASACDIRLGTEGGMIGLPEVKVGAFGGYRIVQEALPAAEARLLALSGRPMAMERAFELGFLQQLHKDATSCLQCAEELAREMAAVLRNELHHEAKICIRDSSCMPLNKGFDREIETGAHVMTMQNSLC